MTMTTVTMAALAALALVALAALHGPRLVRAAVVLTPGVHSGNSGNDVTGGTGSDAAGNGGTASGGDAEGNGNWDDVEVVFADPEARGGSEGGGGDGGGDGAGGALDVGHLELQADRMTEEDWLVFVCHRAPSNVPDCHGVPSIR